MIIEFLQSLSYSDWFVLGLILLTLEVFVGGAVCMWIGFSALILGLAILIFPETSWQLQLVFFGVGSIASLFAWHRYMKQPESEDSPVLNQRGSAYVGKIYTLENDIEEGNGKLSIDDTIWSVSGEDMKAGSRIKVISLEGTILNVELVEDE